MKQKKLTRAFSAVLAAALVMTATLPAYADVSGENGSTEQNADVTNDLSNSDIIDISKTGSLTIHKYDITAATQAGDYTEGEVTATGKQDTALEKTLADYAIEGVEFTYLRVGDIEQYTITDGTGTQVNLVYEIPGELAAILGLADEDGNLLKTTTTLGKVDGYELSGDTTSDEDLRATDMDDANIATENQCTETGVYHYTSDQLNKALANLIEQDYVLAKDVLESYISNSKSSVAMDYTDASGVTTKDGLELGLYLIVETAVPENVVDTVNPFFVSIPMTNETADDGHEYDDDNDGGSYWFYDIDVYPKNQTGNPTLDKMVRNATGENASSTAEGGTEEDLSYIVTNTTDDYDEYGKQTTTDGTEALEEFVEDRGDSLYSTTNNGQGTIAGATDTDSDNNGLTDGNSSDGTTTDEKVTTDETTKGEYQYSSTTTASAGDVLDYILVSKIPHISSAATFLTQYTFTDTLSTGITYNEDTKIAFYTSAADAYINNTANAVAIWDDTTGYYSVDYDNTAADGSVTMTVKMTTYGLNKINGDNGDKDVTTGYSDYYMVVYYTATVDSDNTLVMGDEGNENDVTLTWSRTSDIELYVDTLEDKCIVYSYGIDLTKEFSDTDGNFADVTFNLYNKTDGYYVTAEYNTTDGVYYVTGKSTSQEDATVLTVNSEGKLIIYGLEGDCYSLTELSTTNGYSLLADQIIIDITTASKSIQAAVAGWTGQDYDVTAIDYNKDGSIKQITLTYDGKTYYWADGKYYDSSYIELSSEDLIKVLGNNLAGKVDMVIGELTSGKATVDNVPATLKTDGTSENAIVAMTVTNTKNFTLPLTGGAGLYLITILGVIAVACGCWVAFGKKDKNTMKAA